MNTMQGPKMASSVFIGRWTPKILFSLRDRPCRHGQLGRQLGSVSAHTDQNSPQSRIRGVNRQACDAIEGHHGRIFIDQTGKDNHRSTRRHVPLGEAIPQGRER